MNRKVLFIAAGILLVIIAAVGYTIVVSKKNVRNAGDSNKKTAQQQDKDRVEKDREPQQVNNTSGQPLKISDGQVVSPALSSDHKAIWYFSPDGHLFKQNLDTGLKQEYVLPSHFKVDNVIWPISGNDFITETRSGSVKTFSHYNSATRTHTPYPPNVRSVDFMPDGSRVAYEWVEENGKGGISIADNKLRGHQKIVDLPDADAIIKVSSLGNKMFSYRSSLPTDGKLYYITADTKKIYPIKTAASNAAIWLPDGQRFIFTKLGPDGNKNSTTLWLGDSVTANDKSLDISAPFSKVAFDSSGNNLYYAASATEGGHEVFWKIDLNSMQKRQIYAGGSSVKINSSNLLAHKDGALLLFVNSDGFLYSVPINQ